MLFRCTGSSRVSLPAPGALLGGRRPSFRHLLEHGVASPSSAVSGSRLSLGDMWDTGLVWLCPGGTGDAGPAAACPGRFPKLGHIQTAQQKDAPFSGIWQGQVAQGLWWLCPHCSLTHRSGNGLQLPELAWPGHLQSPRESLSPVHQRLLCLGHGPARL